MEELEALTSMIRVVKPFHPGTAEFINEFLEQRRSEPPIVDEDPAEEPLLLRNAVMTNLGVDFEAQEILGRDIELEELERFWLDPTPARPVGRRYGGWWRWHRKDCVAGVLSFTPF